LALPQQKMPKQVGTWHNKNA